MNLNLKKLCAAMMLLALFLMGCVQPDDTPTTEGSTAPETTTQTQPETTTQTQPDATGQADTVTEPHLPGFPDVVGSAELKQLRMPGYSVAWVSQFQGRFGAYAVVNSEEGMTDLLQTLGRMGKDIERPGGYDATFFAQNYLVLIPMQSNSGSVRYKAETSLDGGIITITLKAEMPEIGTTDMADWLLLVALPRDQFPEDAAISISGGQTGGGVDNFHDK